MKYSKYKIYIRKTVDKVMATSKVIMAKTKKSKKNKRTPEAIATSDAGTVTFVTTDTDPNITGKITGQIFGDIKPVDDKPHGHFEGVNWVWPNGKKTHVRFLDLAIRQMRPLPRGFYEEAEKETYLTNVKNMLRKAKQLKLPADVDRE